MKTESEKFNEFMERFYQINGRWPGSREIWDESRRVVIEDVINILDGKTNEK